ncbi:MAG: transporter [Thermodesulfovibrionales bacterium]|nr:transporter [Thermodesulfovibrionales bacterium]
MSLGTLKKVLICTVGLYLLLFLAGNNSVLGTEGGGGAYPNGAEDFMAGAVPPPGIYFLNYFTFYTADKFMDNSGKSAIPDFDLNVTANVFRLLYVSKTQIFGGNWGMHVFIPLLNVDVELPIGSQSKTGIGDIIIDPFILSWHFKNWHFATGIDIYIPTGQFDKNRLANLGRNYWTFEPIFAFTYLSDSGVDVSCKFMYDFNTKNKDTNYKSGQEFHFDYTLGKRLQNWHLGIGGYYYKQLTSDKLNGQRVLPDGNKGRAFAIGPQAKYDYKNMSFVLKYQKEFEVKNKPEGDKFWFKFVYAF